MLSEMAVKDAETYAYLAGLIDGEGYLVVIHNRAKSHREKTKHGYARVFEIRISSMDKWLLETVQKNVGMGFITTHHHSACPLPSFELRFFPNQLRLMLPKLIPYLILKKELAILMLKMLIEVKSKKPYSIRDSLLTQYEKEFREKYEEIKARRGTGEIE